VVDLGGFEMGPFVQVGTNGLPYSLLKMFFIKLYYLAKFETG
jgi:hypothetical protein